MENEIISYIEMCRREASSLQRGMNYGLSEYYSVILMSVSANAPYNDRLEEGGSILIYEGHDIPQSPQIRDPKAMDQPELTSSGLLTENGKFFRSALEYKAGAAPPRLVKVYEKIRPGIWSYNGVFHLVDSWREQVGSRSVFKFKLIAVQEDPMRPSARASNERRRIIPSAIKMEVWKRDQGKCVVCGATDELHFDHDLPYSLGGTSLRAENVQLMCARHNLAKGSKIL